jgi:uncharacterized protein YecE (DUF72 family)
MKYIGTAGWSLPKECLEKFPDQGSHLERYARVFSAVEINSSFYREHMSRTYERWAASVPDDFRFSVKLSREFTHNCDLQPNASKLARSLQGIQFLGDKLGVILLQFPGSLEFHPKKMERFFKLLRKSYHGPLALEARNCTWIGNAGKNLMYNYGVSKVIADPERCPGGPKKLLTSGGLAYYRLHGSPVIYRSSYQKKFLTDLKREISSYKKVWVIFDNTTFGEATKNALSMLE